MSTLIVQVTTAKSSTTVTRDFEHTTSDKYAAVQSVSEYVQSVITGNQYSDGSVPPTVNVSVKENATRASGTFILDTVIATDAISINGVTFTAVASGATGNQFNIGVTDLLTATSLAAAINASATALVNQQVTAAVTTSIATPATVTVYSKNYGVFGNSVTIASADATITASGARLTSGAVDATAKNYTF